MSLYAVAKLVSNNKLVGVRLVDDRASSVVNYTTDNLIAAINSGLNVKNLKVNRSGLLWVQGSERRYPSINSDGSVLNKAALTVVYKDEDICVVANYLGKLRNISFNDISRLRDKLKMTNCKIVRKVDRTLVVSLGGPIEGRAEVEFVYDEGTLQVIIALNAKCKKIRIPKEICDHIVTSDDEVLVLGGDKRTRYVEHLILPDSVDKANESLLKWFPKLKVVEYTNVNRHL